MRVGGFVGGDHRELIGTIFLGSGGERPGAEDVVADYGDGIFFHQGNVFEGGGVEDLCGAIFFEEIVQQRGIVDVAEDGDDLGRRRRDRGGDFGVDFVEILFGVIEENHGVGSAVPNWGAAVLLPYTELPSEGGADAAAGAGDQDDFVKRCELRC